MAAQDKICSDFQKYVLWYSGLARTFVRSNLYKLTSKVSCSEMSDVRLLFHAQYKITVQLNSTLYT